MSKWSASKARQVLHDDAEIGPKMLPRIAKETGLKPEDL